MKKVFILFGVIVSVALIGFVTLKDDQENVVKNKRKENLVSEPLLSNTDERISKTNTSSDSSSTELKAESAVKPSESWCRSEEDFSEQEMSIVRNESLEWAVERGEILFPNRDSAFEQYNSSLLAPYIEAELSELIEHAKNDDKFALITLVQRNGTPRELKELAAQHLLVLGNTSVALSYLVIKEMTSANYIYEEEGAINDKIKSHMMKSLAYVDYGLERLDVSALRAYLVILNQHERGLNQLDPETVLSEQEMSQVNDLKENIIASINEKRVEKYLEPIGSLPLPNVAIRDFESSLAVEYANFGELISGSRNLKAMDYNFEDKSNCLKQLIARY